MIRVNSGTVLPAAAGTPVVLDIRRVGDTHAVCRTHGSRNAVQHTGWILDAAPRGQAYMNDVLHARITELVAGSKNGMTISVGIAGAH